MKLQYTTQKKTTHQTLKTFQGISGIRTLSKGVRLEQSCRSYFKGTLLLRQLWLEFIKTLDAYGQNRKTPGGISCFQDETGLTRRERWVGITILHFKQLCCLLNPAFQLHCLWVLHRLGGSRLGSSEADLIPGRQSALCPWQVLCSLYWCMMFWKSQELHSSFNHTMHIQLCKFTKTRPVFMSTNPALRGRTWELDNQSATISFALWLHWLLWYWIYTHPVLKMKVTIFLFYWSMGKQLPTASIPF